MAAFAVLAGALLLGVGAKSPAQQGHGAGEADRPEVAGFRSARFGMPISETLEAMQLDFQLGHEDVAARPNDEDKTMSLVATVKDIFPGSGPAQVVYIHGYRQKKLIQVNVLWGAPVTEEPDPQTLVTTANILQKYFHQLGFDAQKTVMNTRVDDGSFIVFRATDEQERMVLLQLLSRKVAAKGEETAEPQTQVVSLWLSYIENTRDPDIFRIEKGKF